MLNIDYDKLNIETLGSLDLINKAQHDGTKANVLNLIRHYSANGIKPMRITLYESVMARPFRSPISWLR